MVLKSYSPFYLVCSIVAQHMSSFSNNEDEDNSSNILSDNNYQLLSQKFRQIICKNVSNQALIEEEAIGDR